MQCILSLLLKRPDNCLRHEVCLEYSFCRFSLEPAIIWEEKVLSRVKTNVFVRHFIVRLTFNLAIASNKSCQYSNIFPYRGFYIYIIKSIIASLSFINEAVQNPATPFGQSHSSSEFPKPCMIRHKDAFLSPQHLLLGLLELQ